MASIKALQKPAKSAGWAVKVKRAQLVSVKPRFKGSSSKRIAQACRDTSEVFVARACLNPAFGSHAVRATSRYSVRHLTKGAQALLLSGCRQQWDAEDAVPREKASSLVIYAF